MIRMEGKNVGDGDRVGRVSGVVVAATASFSVYEGRGGSGCSGEEEEY